MTLRSLAPSLHAAAASIPESLLGLLARLAAGQVFWRAGQTKVEGFHLKESTIFLFREEYRVPLLPPEVAAAVTAAAENGLSALLIIGLAARLSAFGLLLLTVAIQVLVYPEGWPDHILWVTALLVVIARGPGLFSLDNLVFARPGPPR